MGQPPGEKPLTALIVGSGAVQNAWAPVIRVLQPHFDFPLTPDGANSFLARIVYLLRWYATSPGEDSARHLREFKAFLVELRAALCRERKLAQKQGELSVRPEFYSVVDQMLLAQSHSFMLVTTNWDTVVPYAMRRHIRKTMDGELIPLHIHGSVARQDTLYLPTEVTKEPYRSHEEDQHIGRLHGDIWRGLEKAHRAVVYGLSLSPLDAELCQTLAVGWDNPNLREICVISPDHELVAHRVNLLLGHERDIAVKGFIPNDLASAIDYTVRRQR